MRRRVLFLVGLVALLNVPALAQIGVVLQLTPTANVDAVASRVGGVVLDLDSDANQVLLSVPAVPSNLLDSDIQSVEVVEGTTLPSAPHARYLRVPATTPSDWYKTQPAFGLINLSGALTCSTGRTIVVALIDSQVDYGHPALIGHLTSGYDFVLDKKTKGLKGLTKPNESSASYLDESSASYLEESSASYLDESSASYLDQSAASYLDESSASYLDGLNPAYKHGTFNAGIIAALAPEAMIMPLRVFDDRGSSDTWVIIKAIRYAVKHGAQVINVSLGATPTRSAAFAKALDYARARNVVVTVSAGNNNTNATSQCPACFGYPRVITTAATGLDDVKALYSNWGEPVYVDAPGTLISAVPGGLYGVSSGTSHSAPIIAATAAHLRAQLSTASDVGSRIAAGAVDINAKNLIYAGQLGFGRIDMSKAVNCPLLP